MYVCTYMHEHPVGVRTSTHSTRCTSWFLVHMVYTHAPKHPHTPHTYAPTLSHTLVHILRPPDLSKDPDPFPDVTGDIIFVWKHLCQHEKAYVLPCGTFQEFYESLQMSSSMANTTLLARGGQSTRAHTLKLPCVLELSGPVVWWWVGSVAVYSPDGPAGLQTGV